jgi:SSS family solute:Na+ symporter
MSRLALLLVYAAAQVALGLWISRRLTGTKDFFVAGRRLGGGLIFSTLLAANIGAGSTVGVAGIAYQYGISATWFVASAALGSFVLAFFVGPRIRRLAATHDLRTVGDFLEWRFDRRVRASIALLLWIGTLAILAGQFLGIAFLLEAALGLPRLVGCSIGGAVVTAYFTAGGLRSAAVVNVVQLVVKMVGFMVALPMALLGIGGLAGLRAAVPSAEMWNPWQNGPSGWMYLAMLTPAFIVSPGILQKVYGAKDDRAVRAGVGLNALALLIYAPVPVILGMIALANHPGLPARDLALPTLLMHDVPAWVGSLGLAALFSAEVSAADALLFMLATSLSQDLYRRFVNPAATEAQVLRVARLAAVAGGIAAIALAVVAKTVIDALTIFYTLLGVSLFVPMIAGLYDRRAGPVSALASAAAGVGLVLLVHVSTGGRGAGGLTPAMTGLMAAAVAFAIVRVMPVAPKTGTSAGSKLAPP